MPYPRHMKVDEAETIAAKALGFLAANHNALERFLALTGITPQELATRARAGDASLFAAVLDHYLNFEPDLLALCDAEQLKPTDPAEAARLLAQAPRR